MNRSDFLNRLEKALGNMKWEQKKEVLYDYEEYFVNAASDGKSEEQAAKELGNPEEIALGFLQGEEKQEGEFEGRGAFATAIKGMVKSALNFASKSLNEALKLEKIQIESCVETEVSKAESLIITGCKGADVKIFRHSAPCFSGKLTGIASTDRERVPSLTSSLDEAENKLSFSIDWKGQTTASIIGEIEINVPESFSGNVSVETVSGDLLKLPEKLRNLTFKSVSGEIKSETIDLEDEIRINTVSGRLKCSSIRCKKVNFKSVSGGFSTVLSGHDEINFNSTSGSMHVELSALPGKILFNSISGGIKLKVHPDSGLDLSFKSVSGRLKTDLPFVVENEKKGYGSYSFQGRLPGRNSIEVCGKTVSGSIKIGRGE
ncbi:MAG: DUF1700 domain-containing protein [Candidatus Riflebacteria bacterium]